MTDKPDHTTYSGVCIGGPLSGKRINNAMSEIYHTKTASGDVLTYCHSTIGGNVGTWQLDSMTYDQCVDHVLKIFNEHEIPQSEETAPVSGRKKVWVEVDETNNLYDPQNGCLIITWPGLPEIEESMSVTTRDLIKLKDAGYEAEEIVILKKGGVIK